MNISERLVIFGGVATWLTLALGVVIGLVGGKSSKISELQLSGDPEEVRRIVQQPDASEATKVKRLDAMHTQLTFDYVFLFLYWLAFVSLAIMLARRGGAGFRAVGLLAALVATATALLDVMENIRTGGILGLSGSNDQVRRRPVSHLRQTSLLKWAASAATLALLSVLFVFGTGRALAVGVGLIAVSLVGFLSLRWNRLVRLYMALFFAVGLVIAVWFTFSPGDVISHL